MFLSFGLAFASMLNPELNGREYWSAVMGKMIGAEFGLGTLVAGVMMGGGIVLLIGGLRGKGRVLALGVAVSVALLIGCGLLLMFYG